MDADKAMEKIFGDDLHERIHNQRQLNHHFSMHLSVFEICAFAEGKSLRKLLETAYERLNLSKCVEKVIKIDKKSPKEYYYECKQCK